MGVLEACSFVGVQTHAFLPSRDCSAWPLPFPTQEKPAYHKEASLQQSDFRLFHTTENQLDFLFGISIETLLDATDVFYIVIRKLSTFWSMNCF